MAIGVQLCGLLAVALIVVLFFQRLHFSPRSESTAFILGADGVMYPRMKVLITGGSGYLGLYLSKELTAGGHVVGLTFNSRSLTEDELAVLGHPLVFKVDLTSGDGLEDLSNGFGTPDVVVNCAAISVPRECEKDPERARAVNVPRPLVKWLTNTHKESGLAHAPLLIHLSTDQVYEGLKANNLESDEAKPVNQYGVTKLEAEKFIKESWQNYAILRSSLIVGPAPLIELKRGLALQWMDATLAAGKETDFFEDEYRCPIFIKDIERIVERLMEKHANGEVIQELFNLGGPDRLSRLQMAEMVAVVRGYSRAPIKAVPAASVNRGVASPPDISMDSSHLTTTLGISLTPFEEAVRQSLK
eukprot:TRINITY_DN412_c0_g1_i1.p1 TRINITY_DN412_c0_g1~~TRINITY_DN412_c0_g1_i1.p1  ORF type:complete len:371 (+),score=61.63 TRINITY_DN412_c0_g1_i1:37-1113(+)